MSLFNKKTETDKKSSDEIFQDIYITYYGFLRETHKKPPTHQEVINMIYAKRELS